MTRKKRAALLLMLIMMFSCSWAQQPTSIVEPSSLMRLLSSLQQYPNVQEIVEDSETVRAALVALAMGEVAAQDSTLAVSLEGMSFIGYEGETDLIIAFPLEKGEYVIFLANAVSGSSEVAKGVTADAASIERVLKENSEAVYEVAAAEVLSAMEDLQSASQTRK